MALLPLWTVRFSEEFPNGRTPERQLDGVKKGAIIFDNLEEAVKSKEKFGKLLSVALLLCDTEWVEKIPKKSGTFKTNMPIYSGRGYMPLEEARREYDLLLNL